MPPYLTSFRFTFFVIVVFIAFTHCSTHRKAQNESSLLHTLVAEKIGEYYSSSNNASSTYGLFVEKRTGDHAGLTLRYIVVRLSERQLVYEGSFRPGNVVWKDDSSIEVTTFSSIRDEVGTKKIVNITNLH